MLIPDNWLLAGQKTTTTTRIDTNLYYILNSPKQSTYRITKLPAIVPPNKQTNKKQTFHHISHKRRTRKIIFSQILTLLRLYK